MSAGGSSINPEGAPQFFENLKAIQRRVFSGEWELPEGASLSRSYDEATVSKPDCSSPQARAFFGRFACFRPERKHIDPASPFGAPDGAQFQFARNLIFESEKRPGWFASLFCRVSDSISEARRRETNEPTAHMTAGDPVKLISVQGRLQWAPSARARWPTSAQARLAVAPDSFWTTTEGGLMHKRYTPSPKIGATLINPENVLSDHTELIAHYP